MEHRVSAHPHAWRQSRERRIPLKYAQQAVARQRDRLEVVCPAPGSRAAVDFREAQAVVERLEDGTLEIRTVVEKSMAASSLAAAEAEQLELAPTRQRRRTEMQVAIVADVANLIAGAPATDPASFVERLLDVAKSLGQPAKKLAFADIRDIHPDVRLKLHAAGFTTIDCPSWRNGGERPKRSDDPTLLVETLEVSHHRPDITAYLLGGADADMLPLIAALKNDGRRVYVLAHPELVGRLLRWADVDGWFDLTETCPETGGNGPPKETPLLADPHPGTSSTEAVDRLRSQSQENKSGDQREGDRLPNLVLETIGELASRYPYVTRTLVIREGPWPPHQTGPEISRAIGRLISSGLLEEYEYRSDRLATALPAIRVPKSDPAGSNSDRLGRLDESARSRDVEVGASA